MVILTRPHAGPARSYRFPTFFDENLPNGIRLLTAPVAKLPLVTMLVLVDAGSTNDPPGKEGVASLTAAGLLEGSQQYDGSELAEEFEKLGTSLESGADWDSAFLKITVLSDKLEQAARLVGETISDPAFPDREIDRLKAERLAEIFQLETEPRGLADEKFSEFLYSSESRYSKPDEGSAGSVASLARRDVQAFYRSNYTRDATTVVIVGDASLERAREIVSSAFHKWPTGALQSHELSAVARTTERNVHIVHKREAPQSELRVGHVGLPRNHADFFSTLVMNAILGGLFGSRINLNLREVHGYTYGASSYFDWRRGPGPFVISTAVESQVTSPALGEIVSEVEKIRREPVSVEELSLAKQYLEGVFPIRYETTSAIASALASLAIYNLPVDYYDTYRNNIHRVTDSMVLEAARLHLQPDRLQTVIVGDADMIRGPVGELGLGQVSIHSA
jgi:zinc protease